MKVYSTIADKDVMLQKNFIYHAPKNDQQERYEKLRSGFKELARLIIDSTPSSREQSTALTNLETSMFWSNAAIARNE